MNKLLLFLFFTILLLLLFINSSSGNISNNYVLFKPYGNDNKCLNENLGGLGYIILANKTCIANNGISLTVNSINEEYAEICKYYSNNCKNVIACEKFIGTTNNDEQSYCYDPFQSSFFYNSPIPSTYTKMYIINRIDNSTYFNSTEFGYNYKQYSSNNNNECTPINQFQYSLYITNNYYYLPNINIPKLSETFICNKELNIPQLIIGLNSSNSILPPSPPPSSIININQTICTNSNNLNNEYNYEITC